MLCWMKVVRKVRMMKIVRMIRTVRMALVGWTGAASFLLIGFAQPGRVVFARPDSAI